MFQSIYVAKLKFSHFYNISLILVMRYGLSFNCLFKFLKLLGKDTQFIFGLGCATYVAPHSSVFALLSYLSGTKRSTSF